MSEKEYYLYILATKKYGALYTGVTGDLLTRISVHKNDLVEGFTKKYEIHKLVYFEIHTDIHEAILREKQIKKWRREWKINLIEKVNPLWIDLYPELTG
jgi:putative endonuclease